MRKLTWTTEEKKEYVAKQLKRYYEFLVSLSDFKFEGVYTTKIECNSKYDLDVIVSAIDTKAYSPFSSDGSYDFLSSADSKLHVYALEEELFHTVDRQSTEVKATKEDYIKAFSDYENGFTQLGLSNWSTVSSIFEKAVESRDSFMFPAFLQHLGLSQDDENFKTCLVNLRRIAGYKRTED